VNELIRVLRRWVMFAGCVLIVAVLYWAQAVLIPVTFALLITFVLGPLVARFERWIGRIPAVVAIVVLAFTLLGLAAWGFTNQMTQLATDLPRFRDNIRQKIVDVRATATGGSVQQVQETLKDIQSDVVQSENAKGTPAQPVVVRSAQVATLWGFPDWLGPVLGPLSTAGLVVTLVIFMLLEREDLRGRIIGLIGHGHLAVTTKAFDEAGMRVSRQLSMQGLVNAIYGVCVGLFLHLLGIPYPLFWGAFGAALRFVPYVGAFVAAAGPVVVAIAALPGWRRPLEVAGFFVGLELFTNLVLETVLYAGAAGVSQVALLVAVAFWTWLWGPMGLLLATPLTVCVVVLGKHVPGFEFLSTLMADEPALAPDVAYYQRLLARDQSEASDIIARHFSTQTPESVFDEVMLPALTYAVRDRLEGRLSDQDERTLIEETRELLNDIGNAQTEARSSTERVVVSIASETPAVLTVLGVPVNGESDSAALEMLAHLVSPEGIRIEISSIRLLSSEIVTHAREHGTSVVCLADLPPSTSSKTRYLVRKLRAALPEATILVGRWAPAVFGEEDRTELTAAGANQVATTLLDTREHLRELAMHVQQHRPPTVMPGAA
jgi:predicted PurR-regulated permease PerM/methylmalonyl-CoA mutase cobalamin-binding subunit